MRNVIWFLINSVAEIQGDKSKTQEEEASNQLTNLQHLKDSQNLIKI